MTQPLNIAFGSTNHYLVPCRSGYLLIDAGWAGTLPQLRAGLARYGIAPSALRYVMLTHCHPDHAGLTQEVKQTLGARLVIHERQIPYLPELLAFYQRKGGYQPITVEKSDLIVTAGDSRQVLNAVGIAGEIVEMPGHSEDSISLFLDGGSALVGDLPPPNVVEADRAAVVRASWERLLRLGLRTVYASHAGPFQAADVERALADSSTASQ